MISIFIADKQWQSGFVNHVLQLMLLQALDVGRLHNSPAGDRLGLVDSNMTCLRIYLTYAQGARLILVQKRLPVVAGVIARRGAVVSIWNSVVCTLTVRELYNGFAGMSPHGFGGR